VHDSPRRGSSKRRAGQYWRKMTWTIKWQPAAERELQTPPVVVCTRPKIWRMASNARAEKFVR
jgi:hypothetical protein